mgnify:CR=1 FL=1|tara:strand:+ start:1609 stop:3159 length:1551 start_codon:yes stop_codon:yes gene_type:complete
MSAHKSVKDLPKGGEKIDGSKVAGAKMLFALLGVIGLGGILIAFFMDGESHEDVADQASYSYLFAFTFALTLGMGGLFWTILHHATNSGWGISVRRQMENIMGLLPWVFVLSIPFWIPSIREDLWEWEAKAVKLKAEAGKLVSGHLATENAEWSHQVEDLKGKIAERKALLGNLETGGGVTPGDLEAIKEQSIDLEAKLAVLESEKPNAKSVLKHLMKVGDEEHGLQGDTLLTEKWFFYFKDTKLRLVLYTVIFVLIVYLLRSWSIRNDKIAGEDLFKRSRYWSCFFLIPFAAGYTFMVIDFLMSLNYKWFSTMWGVYLFAGAALNGMGLLVIVITWLRSKGYLKEVVSDEHYHLMGKLMFTFCVFWAYIAFSQYFLIWYANITEETEFFLLRNSGEWRTVSMALVVGHFFIPFVILLWRGVKKKAHLICTVAVWNLVMHVVDVYWIVIPERAPSLSALAHSKEPVLWYPGALLFDLLALVGVVGVLGYVLIHIIQKSSLYPCGDPRLEESINVVN